MKKNKQKEFILESEKVDWSKWNQISDGNKKIATCIFCTFAWRCEWAGWYDTEFKGKSFSEGTERILIDHQKTCLSREKIPLLKPVIPEFPE